MTMTYDVIIPGLLRFIFLFVTIFEAIQKQNWCQRQQVLSPLLLLKCCRR